MPVDAKQPVGRLYRVDGLPLTSLVDRGGRVRGASARATNAMPGLVRHIKELQSQ